jgi:hypothetical protein
MSKSSDLLSSSKNHREGSEASLSPDELQREREEELKFNLTRATDGDTSIPDTKLYTTNKTTLSRFQFHIPYFCWRHESKWLDHFTKRKTLLVLVKMSDPLIQSS